jgi:HlyD family secretion protein
MFHLLLHPAINVLRVPDTALTFIPADIQGIKTKENSSSVWILEDGQPKQIILTTGESNGTFTEITSGELKEGSAVITGYASNGTEQNTSSNGQGMRPPPMF